jgi:hypothetical protein
MKILELANNSKDAGSVLSPEICIVVVLRIIRQPGHPEVRESRRFLANGRQQSLLRYGEQEGHHRGQRPGHGSIGDGILRGRALIY